MALSGNEPKIRFMDTIYTVKKRIVTDIERILASYSQTAVSAEVVESKVEIPSAIASSPAILFCPDCKQFFFGWDTLNSHLAEDAEDAGVLIHEKTGYSSQNKALKAWYAD